MTAPHQPHAPALPQNPRRTHLATPTDPDPMSDAMPRFRYPFEALLQRQRWRLDATWQALAKVQLQHHRLHEDIQRMQRDCESLARVPDPAARIDPGWFRVRLDHLHRRRMAVQVHQAQLDDLQRRQQQLRLDCGREQARLDGLKAHRDRHRQAFAIEQDRRSAALRDQEAVMRWSRREITLSGSRR